MKLKGTTIFLGYLKQLLLVVGLVYAFSNCQVKKSILHFVSVEIVEVSQKSQSPLPTQESCSHSVLKKNTLAKKAFTAPQAPILPPVQSSFYQVVENIVFPKERIDPILHFNKKSITYPALFIVFKNLKIAPPITSIWA